MIKNIDNYKSNRINNRLKLIVGHMIKSFLNAEKENNENSHKKNFKLSTSYRSTWWAPKASQWWIGVLFAIGSIFFALGAFPLYGKLVGSLYNNITFFIGSVFFTLAAFLQYLESINSSQNPDHPLNNISSIKEIKLWKFAPSNINWWSVLIQLLGTLLFNISTFYAIHTILSPSQADNIIWTPDAFGSICFLIASALAWINFNHKILAWKPRNISWWINAVNFLGSVAFGISAVFAYVIPSTNLPENIVLMNLETFIGAILFLIGAILLLPERAQISSDRFTNKKK